MSDALTNLEIVEIDSFDHIVASLKEMNVDGEKAEKIAENLRRQYATLGDKTADVTEGQLRLNNAAKNFSKSAQTAAKTGKTLAQNFVKVGQSISQTAMLINNIKGLIDTLNN
jgi:hypothetical protein